MWRLLHDLAKHDVSEWSFTLSVHIFCFVKRPRTAVSAFILKTVIPNYEIKYDTEEQQTTAKRPTWRLVVCICGWSEWWAIIEKKLTRPELLGLHQLQSLVPDVVFRNLCLQPRGITPARWQMKGHFFVIALLLSLVKNCFPRSWRCYSKLVQNQCHSVRIYLQKKD